MFKENIKILLAASTQDRIRDFVSVSNTIQIKNIYIEIVNSTQQVIAVLLTSPPDLMLVDVTKDIDGFEIFQCLTNNQLINNQLLEIEIIFIASNHILMDLRNKLINLDVDKIEYLKTPLDLEELKVKIKNKLKIIQFKKELEVKNRELSIEREEKKIILSQLRASKQIESNYLSQRIFDKIRFELDTEKNLAKQARQEEAKLALLVRSSPDPIALVSFPDIRYIEVNDNFCRVFGYARSEVIGFSASEINIWSNYEECTTIIDILRSGRTIRNYEIELRGANNEIKTMLFSAELIEIEEQQYILGTARDITERKIAEAAQQQSEERLQLALEASDLGMWDWNLASGTVYRDWRWEKMLGYESGDIPNTRDAFIELVHPEDLHSVNTALEQHLLGIVQVYKVQFRMRSKSGDWKWIESCGKIFNYSETGEPLRLTGTHKDITEQKKLERELAIHQARLNAFFNNASVGECILDEQMRFVQVNELLAQINGLTVEEHNGKSIYEVFPQVAGAIEPIFQQVLQTGESIFCQELNTYSLEDINSERYFLASYFAIPGENRRPYGVGIVIVEITDLKRTQEALQQREAQYRAIFENAAVGIAEIELDNRFARVNPQLCEILQYSSSELLTLRVGDITHPEDLFSTHEYIQQLLANQIHTDSLEIRLIRKNQDFVWVNLSMSLVRDSSVRSKFTIGVIKDISSRKQAELALRESQRRYKILTEASPVGVFQCDIQGNYFYFNQRWLEITGMSFESGLGKGWTKALHPDECDSIFATWNHAMSNQTLYRLEHRFIRPDGTIVWVIAQAVQEIGEDGEIKACIGTITDITELKDAFSALHESAERERTITQAIQRMRQTLDLETIFAATTEQLREVINCDRVVVYRFNTDWSGQFVAESVSPGWVSLMNEHQIDPNFAVGVLNTDTCVVQNMNSSDKVIDTYLQNSQGGAYNRGTSFLCVPDIYSAGFDTCYIELLERFQAKAYITVPIFCGNKLWGLLACYQNSTPRQWKTGEINIVVQIGNQLGVALQQAELLAQTQLQSQALQQAAVAADAANRAKTEFLASMSHELRTPLNAILGFTQLMSRDKNLSEEQQQDLGIINRAGEHLLILINDILEMSKIEAGQSHLNISSFDLISLLNTLKEMLQFRATSKGLILAFEYDSNIPQYIQTDDSKLRQVLLNLLGNAIKFTTSGSVTLRVSLRQGEPQFLVFEVTDTGPGISPKEIELVFEAFGQTETGRKSQQGTGLGLTISRKYVKMMGGDIWVNSTPDVGSTFTFDIEIQPVLSNDISTNSLTKPIIGLAPNQPTYRVIVVDDAEDSRIFIVKLLTSIGFAVKEAVNGREAISIWTEWQPNLILMDLRMPTMDGYAATREIKRRSVQKTTSLPYCPIIIALTANVFSEQRKAIVQAGCDDFINKPFREELLLEKIQQHLKLEYLYEDTTSNKCEDIHSFEPMLSDAEAVQLLSKLPSELLEELYHTAASCSDNLILNLVEQISVTENSLFNFLQNLARNYDFEKIMELASLAINS